MDAKWVSVVSNNPTNNTPTGTTRRSQIQTKGVVSTTAMSFDCRLYLLNQAAHKDLLRLGGLGDFLATYVPPGQLMC